MPAVQKLGSARLGSRLLPQARPTEGLQETGKEIESSESGGKSHESKVGAGREDHQRPVGQRHEIEVGDGREDHQRPNQVR